ncbi:hypothetical protein HC256_010076 [Beauveria bassiana]|nr:hypothetical protein HC256_010076 [Beauveria bassiana]
MPPNQQAIYLSATLYTKQVTQMLRPRSLLQYAHQDYGTAASLAFVTSHKCSVAHRTKALQNWASDQMVGSLGSVSGHHLQARTTSANRPSSPARDERLTAGSASSGCRRIRPYSTPGA